MMYSIARQPIFDKKLNIFGYELLYRGDALDSEGRFNHDGATLNVLYTSLFELGIEKLTKGKPAFINFSSGLLTSGIVSKLPRKQIVIEILEHIEPDESLFAICENLKKKGYRFALDDFLTKPQSAPLLPLATIIKVDFLNTSTELCAEIPQRFAEPGRVFLAEKVETYAQYQQALKWGYTLFQGYFFCRPQRFDITDIRGNKQICFQLLKAMQDETIAMDQLEQIIQKDLFLSFGIIKFINSASFGFRTKVQSLKHALAILGIKKIRDFSTILLLKRLGDDKPEELVVTSLIRGRFAESLAIHIGMAHKAGEAFLVGLFSLVDALLDRPMWKILKEIPLTEEVSEALLNRPGVLTFLLDTVVSYEQANWSRHDECLHGFDTTNGDIQQLYFDAVAWAEKIAGMDGSE